MAPPLITDRLLRSWLRCRRRAWLDRHGDPGQRLWTAHRALALSDQLASFQSLLPEKPGHGEAACAAAAPGVVGLRLRGRSGADVALEAHPALLERVPGASVWGEHAYRPVLGRQGRNPPREHRWLRARWGRLLAERQQAPVPQALVVAGAGRALQRERLTLSGGLQAQLEEALSKLALELGRREPPPLVADRKKCVLCSWRGLCDQEARRDGHLSEVSGIGGRRREMLLDQGITSLPQLAASDPQQLAEALAVHGDQHRDSAAALVAQARVQASGRPECLLPEGPEPLPELATAPGVLLYDIESDPDARDDFLHGFVVVRRDSGGAWPRLPQPGESWPYRPLLALQEHGEERLWRRLRRYLAGYPGWPLLHYGETEAIALLRLARRQGADEAEVTALRARLLDVHARLRRHWRLPVNSYGLKAVAGWLGFRWSQNGVDGARCLLWWRQWRRDGGARRLQRIFTYNRDDNLATWAVVRWLLDQEA
ncbi:TM0106 family RecB-like putative nuclease [Cyanobium sp. CH-040]|uniref:TM0106 family RecB-like putative nuclease n=1 Tax=Cyanobium sp. CH-040 TaxID=2823708 RepID=UPI0020CD10B4|nr:TM0106 family RecB-like putative nuclease [Cyanobium sp. CH-040]MCP9927398.1 TM0106 family RecB-like putative nuclease [Cyanobium sp. CH-040]